MPFFICGIVTYYILDFKTDNNKKLPERHSDALQLSFCAGESRVVWVKLDVTKKNQKTAEKLGCILTLQLCGGVMLKLIYAAKKTSASNI